MSTTATWISKKEGRCGGDACVRDTRITVWGLVSQRRLGMPDAEILTAVQGLTPDDLQAAWEYAAENSVEIDRAIKENEESEEGFVE
jgi:type III restriction enzyme